MGTGNNTFYQQMISFHKWSGKTDKHGYLFPLVKKLVYKKKKILLEMGREKKVEAGRIARNKQLGVLSTKKGKIFPLFLEVTQLQKDNGSQNACRGSYNFKVVCLYFSDF